MILPEYRETIFKASPPEGGWPEYFHIITAYNPGKIISDEDNASADEELRRDLECRGLRYLRIKGYSPDQKHHEQGWMIEDITREQALEIGRRYGQNAIFEIEKGVLFVIGCLSGARQQVGNWEDRIIGRL